MMLKLLLIQLNIIPLYIIKYEGKIYKVSTKNYYDSIEATWRCEFYRRTKDLDADENRFCDAAIKGFRNIFFIYLLK